MTKLKIATALLALVGTPSAFAADALLTFNGSIILPTCTVESGSANQTIDLLAAKTTDFAAVGATNSAKAFNVNLSNCAAGTNVSMTVSGTTDTVASVLKNAGTAAQVGVQLLKATNTGDTTGTPLALNTLLTLGAADANNALAIPMVAQYYRLGTMTGGTVTASATVNFTYN